MPSFLIHGHCPLELSLLQIRLVDQVLDCHGWVLEEKQLSSLSYQIRFELELRNIMDIYGALARTGVHLTRTAHRTLTQMWQCQKYLPEPKQPRIVTITLRVGLLQEENVRFRCSLRFRPV